MLLRREKICELVADALDQLLLSCQHLFNIASLSWLDFQAPALSRSRAKCCMCRCLVGFNLLKTRLLNFPITEICGIKYLNCRLNCLFNILNKISCCHLLNLSCTKSKKCVHTRRRKLFKITFNFLLLVNKHGSNDQLGNHEESEPELDFCWVRHQFRI